MKFEAAKCPACGGELRLPADRTIVKCMFCGLDIVVKDAIQAAGIVTVANLTKLADAAARATNYQEAYDYYTRVLELDSGKHEAWLGKGIAAGRLSSLAKPRTEEMFSAIETAIGHATQYQKEVIKVNAAATISSMIADQHRDALNRFQSAPVLGTWYEYLQRSNSMIQALERAHKYDPTNGRIMEWIVYICTDNLAGKRLNDAPFYMPKDHPSTTSRAVIRERYIQKIQESDPSYDPPAIKKASEFGCFIATATMGKDDHPVVNSIKAWRDSKLIPRRGGRAFVSMYYRLGIYPAKVIRKSIFLRKVCYWLIIRPLTWWISKS